MAAPMAAPGKQYDTAKHYIPRIQVVIAILWPSFLVAGLATVLFFTAFDPVVLLQFSPFAELSRLGAYTIGFFFFWLLTASSCVLTCYFQQSCAVANRARQ